MEMVVVEFFGAERRCHPDHALGLLVVDEAERLTLRAALRVCPPAKSLGQFGFQVPGWPFGPQLYGQLIEHRCSIERFAAEVSIRGEVREVGCFLGYLPDEFLALLAAEVVQIERSLRRIQRRAPGQLGTRAQLQRAVNA